jgi:hypothetical protein
MGTDSRLKLFRFNNRGAKEAYRVVWLDLEVGSIVPHSVAAKQAVWRFGIDMVLPLPDVFAQGEALTRDDAMEAFCDAWERFSADPHRLQAFIEAKRRDWQDGLADD